jgi:Ca2+-binding RTX toxin-like protein
MAMVTFADGFSADQLIALFQEMQLNGVTTTQAIGDGPDSITIADTAGNSIVLTGDFTVDDDDNEIHGTLTQIEISQGATVKATATDLGGLNAGDVVEHLSETLNSGGAGVDELHDLFAVFGATAFHLEGGDGDDDLDGDNGDDVIGGGGGDDHIDGGHGHDVLHGNAGDDDLAGGDGNDLLDGGNGDDTADFSGEAGLGGVTASLMRHKGTDTFGNTDHFKSIEDITGSQNDDQLVGDNKSNTIDGNDGNDHIGGLQGDDTLHGGNDDDSLDGGQGKDALFGDDGNDTLNGSVGKDALDGGNGDDTLLGGNGKDILNGGAGADTLTGGRGSDTFVFTSDLTGGPDTITDFKSHLDKIAIDFVPGGPETLDANHFFLSSDLSGLTPGQEALIYDKSTGVLSYDADGAGGQDAIDVAHLKPNTELTKDDLAFLS